MRSSASELLLNRQHVGLEPGCDVLLQISVGKYDRRKENISIKKHRAHI